MIKFLRLLCVIWTAVFIISCSPVKGDGNTAETENNNNNGLREPSQPEAYLNLYNPDNLHEIEIIITQAEWNGLLDDMRKNKKTGNYRKADLVYNGVNGKETVKEIGLRTRGNTTRVIPEENGNFTRAHFKLKFNETFNLAENTDEYKKRRDRRLFNQRAVNLKYAIDDPTHILEQFAYNFMNDQGIYTPKASAAKLYINIGGTRHYYGLYTVIEPVDKSFLTRRYGKDRNEGNIYKCLWQGGGPATLKRNEMSGKIGVRNWETGYRPSYDRQSNKDNRDYSDILDFADKLASLSGNELKNYMDKNFSVDRFLKWIACNQLLGMPDDYWAMGNNYYLYFPNHKDDKIEFIPYDYDHGLGTGWEGPTGDHDKIKNADIFKWFSWTNGSPLITKLLAIPEYKKKYTDYLNELTDPADGAFSADKYKEYYSKREKLYTGSFKNTVDGDIPMSLDQTQVNFIEGRIKSVRSQLNKTDNGTPQPNPDPQPAEDKLSIGFYDYYKNDSKNNRLLDIRANNPFGFMIKTNGTGITRCIINIPLNNGRDIYSHELNMSGNENHADIIGIESDTSLFWEVSFRGYDSNDKLVSEVLETIFLYYESEEYTTPYNNNDDTYTFYFKADEDFWGFNKEQLYLVKITGSFNGWDFLKPGEIRNSMTGGSENVMIYDNSTGLYTLTTKAKKGDRYKIVVYLSENEGPYWLTDKANILREPEDNLNSIVP